MDDFDPMSMNPPEPIEITAVPTPATGMSKAVWDAILKEGDSSFSKASLRALAEESARSGPAQLKE